MRARASIKYRSLQPIVFSVLCGYDRVYSRKNVIDTLNKMMVNLKYAGVLCKSIKDTDRYQIAEKFARELFVWLKPIPKFERPAVSIEHSLMFLLVIADLYQQLPSS